MNLPSKTQHGTLLYARHFQGLLFNIVMDSIPILKRLENVSISKHATNLYLLCFLEMAVETTLGFVKKPLLGVIDTKREVAISDLPKDSAPNNLSETAQPLHSDEYKRQASLLFSIDLTRKLSG